MLKRTFPGTFREIAVSLKRTTPTISNEGFFSISKKAWKEFNECPRPKVTPLSEKDKARMIEEVRSADERKALSAY